MTVSFAARRCPAPVPTPCCPPCRRLAGAYRGSRTRWRNTHRWQPAWRQVRTCLTRRARSLRFLPPLPSIRVVVRCRPKRTAWSFLQKIFGCAAEGVVGERHFLAIGADNTREHAVALPVVTPARAEGAETDAQFCFEPLLINRGRQCRHAKPFISNYNRKLAIYTFANCSIVLSE